MEEQVRQYYEVLQNNGIENVESLSETGDFKLKDWYDGAGAYEKVQGKVINDSVLMYVEGTEFVGFTGMSYNEPYSEIHYLKGLNIKGKDITFPLSTPLDPEKMNLYFHLLMKLGDVQITNSKQKIAE